MKVYELVSLLQQKMKDDKFFGSEYVLAVDGYGDASECVRVEMSPEGATYNGIKGVFLRGNND